MGLIHQILTNHQKYIAGVNKFHSTQIGILAVNWKIGISIILF